MHFLHTPCLRWPRRPQTIDKSGRTVAEVYPDGHIVNLELARMRLAYAYLQYLSGCDANTYLDVDAQAEHYRQVIWRRWENEIKPWDFRKQLSGN